MGSAWCCSAVLNGSHAFDDSVPAPRHSRALARAEPKPLWSLPADAQTVEAIAAARSTHPAALAKFLHGDVAVVVGKALKNEPAERYRSVPDLADDLQRTLDQRPISARPDSAAYRSAKFVRRHWLGVGAALVIVLAVAGGVTGTLLKQHEADRQAREAERQAQRAVAVKRFLLELFDQARSAVKVNGVQAREATIGDILNAGADRVDRAFVKQPEIRDEIFEVLTNLYSESEDRAQMTTLARKRLAAARSSFGVDDRRTVPAEVLLAGVLLGYAESSEAKALLDHAQGVLDRVGDSASFDRARLLRWQGVYLQFNEPTAAWPDHPLRRALALMHQHFADEDEFMEVLVGVPGLACRAGYVDEALAAADELQQRALAKYGIDNIFTAAAMQTRGNLLMLMGRPEEGIPLMQKAIAGFAKFAGKNSPDVIAATLGLAQAQFAAGHSAEAAGLYEGAAALVQREHPGDAQLAGRLARYRTNTQRIQAGDRPHCGA